MTTENELRQPSSDIIATEICMERQRKLGVENPLPMWSMKWIDAETGRQYARVYDNQLRADLAWFKCLTFNPQMYANSWIEPE